MLKSIILHETFCTSFRFQIIVGLFVVMFFGGLAVNIDNYKNKTNEYNKVLAAGDPYHFAIPPNPLSIFAKEVQMFFSLLLTLAGVAHVNPENRPPDTGPLEIAPTGVWGQQARQPLQSEKVVKSVIQALGGDNFFKPKPYILTRESESTDPWDGPKTVHSVDTYRDGKQYSRAIISMKRWVNRSVISETIDDYAKGESWESVYPSTGKPGAWKKTKDPSTPEIPFIKNPLALKDKIIFGSEVSNTTMLEGRECYLVDFRYTTPGYENTHVKWWVGASDFLIYKTESQTIGTKAKSTMICQNYVKYGNIFLPSKTLWNWTDKNGREFRSERSFLAFAFKDDIPDSLFVPKR